MSQKLQFFTDDELVSRLWDKEDIRDLMAKHSYCYSADMRRKELSELWVALPQNRRTASMGVNKGYYTGMDAISNYYVVQNNELRYNQLKPFTDADSNLAHDNRNLGMGIMNFHTVNTPLVYIAEDGRTARYLAYDCGQQTIGKPGDTGEAYFVFGMVYADLIKESEDWKIWHLVMQHDHTIPAGKDYGDVPVYLKPGEDPLEHEMGEPTIQRTVYGPFYGWEYLYQDMPKPYYTYDDLSGYGPDSNMGYKYYERERRSI